MRIKWLDEAIYDLQALRQLIVPGMPYVIPYRVKKNTIEILRVLHTAIQWPEEL